MLIAFSLTFVTVSWIAGFRVHDQFPAKIENPPASSISGGGSKKRCRLVSYSSPAFSSRQKTCMRNTSLRNNMLSASWRKYSSQRECTTNASEGQELGDEVLRQFDHKRSCFSYWK